MCVIALQPLGVASVIALQQAFPAMVRVNPTFETTYPNRDVAFSHQKTHRPTTPWLLVPVAAVAHACLCACLLGVVWCAAGGLTWGGGGMAADGMRCWRARTKATHQGCQVSKVCTVVVFVLVVHSRPVCLLQPSALFSSLVVVVVVALLVVRTLTVTASRLRPIRHPWAERTT